MFPQYVNSQLSVLTGDLPSGVHTLHCRMLFSDSTDPVFVNQELYILRQAIDVSYLPNVIQIPADWRKNRDPESKQAYRSHMLDSNTINQVFPSRRLQSTRASPPFAAPMTPIMVDLDGSRICFHRNSIVLAPMYRDSDSIGNLTEGPKVLEIQLHGTTTTGVAPLDRISDSPLSALSFSSHLPRAIHSPVRMVPRSWDSCLQRPLQMMVLFRCLTLRTRMPRHRLHQLMTSLR